MYSPFDNKDDYADSDDNDIGGKDLFTVTFLIFIRNEDILLSRYLWLKKKIYWCYRSFEPHFKFVRCHHSQAAVSLARFEHDSQ